MCLMTMSLDKGTFFDTQFQNKIEGGYSNNTPEGKKIAFSDPRSQYEVSDHDIREERSSDNPFQVSNLKFHGGSTCGQQALTKVTKIMKKRYLKQKHFLLKMTETATKLILG